MLEPISKSTIHYLAKAVLSRVMMVSRPGYRECISADETKLWVVGVVSWSLRWMHMATWREARLSW